ncbi:MAG: hypothetical protein GPJ51_11605 [Candidatus Heimdallarchaeota archaeon]|nr:hypothetical protein [Candidatus Heimdallarchaeota archaeon]
MPIADNDGIRIHYKVEGEGTPLILLYGFMDTLEQWYEQGYYKEVNVPILLYVGEDDEWGHFPRAKEFCESRASVSLVSFPGRGHDVHYSKDLVFPSINEFLENLK